MTILSWRFLAWKPVFAGLDSWQAGITLAFVEHLQWGPQMLFTFGPYGFVEDILPFSRLTAGLGFIYALTVLWGVAALIISTLRPSWGLLPAAFAAWVALALAANLVEAPELGIALALGLALTSFRVAAELGPGRSGPVGPSGTMARHGLAGGPLSGPGVTSREAQHRRLAVLAALGAFAGLQMLVEIDVGLVSILLAGAAVAGQNGRRKGLLAAGLTFVATVVVGLLVAGQSLTNLLSYLRGSTSVLLGYAPAMSLSSGRGAEDWGAVLDLVLLAAVFAMALRARPRAEQLTVGLAMVGWTWEILKEGFVRHDKHDLIYFALVLVALCLVRLPRAALLQAVAVAVAAGIVYLANGWLPLAMRSPVEDVTAMATEARDLALPAHWTAVQRQAQKQILSDGDTLPAGLLASLRGHTLAVEPLEDALTFAYPTLRWDPEPVLQAYSAYTPYLDHLDAGFLRSAHAPERILYRPAQIDRRDPVWDPPETMEAMYCRYAPMGESDSWLVLARVADRCGPSRLINQVSAHFGQEVSVPSRPGQMVVATFSLSSPLVAQAEGLLLKPPQVELTADGTTYRFLTGTAPDDHVLSAPASLGYPAGTAPTPVHRLELSGGGWGPGQGSARISFYSVALAPVTATS